MTDNTRHFPELFYLVGFQRSGSTLLCHLLDKHPEICCLDEPEVSKRIVFDQMELLNDAGFDSIKKQLDFYGVDAEEYLALVTEYRNSGLAEDYFLRGCYELFNGKGARLVGAKEVVDLVAAQYGYLEKLVAFHDSSTRYIYLERDIKGVVASFMKLGFFPPGKKKLWTLNLKRFAKQYVKCLNEIDKVLSSRNTHRVSYENLVAHPQDEIGRILMFLGVDHTEEAIRNILEVPSQGIRNRFDGFREESVTSWKSLLKEKQCAWLVDLYEKERSICSFV